MHKDGWNVATSQRRDVGSTNIKVNNRKRRDASTSRHLNFAMSQRRDVSASSEFSSLKAKRGAELVVSGIVRTRARKS